MRASSRSRKKIDAAEVSGPGAHPRVAIRRERVRLLRWLTLGLGGGQLHHPCLSLVPAQASLPPQNAVGRRPQHARLVRSISGVACQHLQLRTNHPWRPRRTGQTSSSGTRNMSL